MKAYITYFTTNGRYELSDMPLYDDYLSVTAEVEMSNEEYIQLKEIFLKAKVANRRLDNLWWEARANNARGD